MLILNDKKVIYIHIHKTGGEAVEHVLGKLRTWNDIIITSEYPGTSQEFERDFRLRKHSSARQVAKLIGLDVWNSYLSWATIRNPYDRIASLYGFVASLAEPGLLKIGFPLEETYRVQRDWVESAEYPMKQHWAFAAVRAYLATRGSASPFSEFIRHPVLRPKEPAYQTQFSRLSNAAGDALLVTRVVKLEQLSVIWPSLCKDMGIAETKLVVKNATPNQWKRSAAELLDKAADLELINTIYAEDFRRFDYEIVGRNPVPRVVAASPSVLKA